jgi:hypothetical protein
MNAVLTVTELDRQLEIPSVARVSEGNSGLTRVQITGSFGLVTAKSVAPKRLA